MTTRTRGPAAVRPEPGVLDLNAVPSLRRRLACLVYESILLFAILMIASLVYSITTQQRHALQGRTLGMVFLFAVLALYFVWCWRRGGQTLAMQTWQIRLVRDDGGTPSLAQALARYACGYVWVLPPLALAALNGVDTLGAGGTFAIVAAWVLGYALSSRLHPQRQFWHDALCRTRLVTWRPLRSP